MTTRQQLSMILFFPQQPGLTPQQRRRYFILHQIYLFTGLAILAIGAGLVALILSAGANAHILMREMLDSYLQYPALLLLNILPLVLMSWFFYLLSGHAWMGFLLGGLPLPALAVVNYFKIRLRGDPLLAADLFLLNEATGIMGRYTLVWSKAVVGGIVCLLVGLLVAIVLLRRGARDWKFRGIGCGVLLVALIASYFGLYANNQRYQQIQNTQLINPWSEVEIYASKGFVYSFLHSVQDVVSRPPEGYDKHQAQELLAQYQDAPIPEDRRVNVMGIMLEAYCDLTEFEALADNKRVQAVYKPWHDLARQSVSGHLLTNIFAGNTVDSEWTFLTGYSQYDEFRTQTPSYVWYFREQGYRTQGSHPGYNWFYNRNNVNEYLGFEDYWFSENHYGELVDPVSAAWESDKVVIPEFAKLFLDTIAGGQPTFSFSVTYQNHGPYDDTEEGAGTYVTEKDALSQESRAIINNYLKGLDKTLTAITKLVDTLERSDEPIVLVLFGDHKPWLGNGNSVYTELGEDFDLSTKSGFYSYYETPYIIWANSAAKELLDEDFVGDGGDFSPCFLMNRVFDLLGLSGPGYMQLANETRAVSPLVHQSGRYLLDGQLVDELSGEDEQALLHMLWAQYYLQQEKPG